MVQPRCQSARLTIARSWVRISSGLLSTSLQSTQLSFLPWSLMSTQGIRSRISIGFTSYRSTSADSCHNQNARSLAKWSLTAVLCKQCDRAILFLLRQPSSVGIACERARFVQEITARIVPKLLAKPDLCFTQGFWNLSTSKPKSRFCVDRKSSFSHFDSSNNSIGLAAVLDQLIGV